MKRNEELIHEDISHANKKSKKTDSKLLPVTLLSGFLGSGKTTLVKDMLANVQGIRVALLVNDMAEVNVDGMDIKSIVKRDTELVQLQNGCICCTLRMDLVEEVAKLADSGKFDVLVIESTGISEPMQVAETFSPEVSQNVVAKQNLGVKAAMALGKLGEKAKLDICVTVVDCFDFWDNWKSTKTVQEDSMGVQVPDSDHRSLVSLLTQQIEFADLIILNKIDLVDKATLKGIHEAVRGLNVKAEIIEAEYAKVPLNKLLITGKFDLENARNSSGWMQDLEDHKPETLEYNIASFSYSQRRPFHPERLYEWICNYFILSFSDNTQNHEGEMHSHGHDDSHHHDHEHDHEACNRETNTADNKAEDDDVDRVAEAKAMEDAWNEGYSSKSRLLRSKGVAWIAGFDEVMLHWSQSGRFLELVTGFPWMAEVEPEDWEKFNVDANAIVAELQNNPTYGDRNTTLVFIGQSLDQKKLIADLDACLMNDEEMAGGMEAWAEIPNPFVGETLVVPSAPTFVQDADQNEEALVQIISDDGEITSAVARGFVQKWNPDFLTWAKDVAASDLSTREVFFVPRGKTQTRKLQTSVGQWFKNAGKQSPTLFSKSHQDLFTSFLQRLLELYPEDTEVSESRPTLKFEVAVNEEPSTKYYDLSTDFGIQTTLCGEGLIIAQNDAIDWEYYDQTQGGILEESEEAEEHNIVLQIQQFNDRLVSADGTKQFESGDLILMIGEELTEYPCVFREPAVAAESKMARFTVTLTSVE